MPRNKWICPICHTALPFKTLYIDDYVTDILQKTAECGREDLETVAIDRGTETGCTAFAQ